MKKEWVRSTRLCDPTQLPSNLKLCIDNKFKEIDEGLDVLFCVETTATRLKTGLFGGNKKTILTALLLTPRWLVQAVDDGDKNNGVYCLLHYLDKMEVSYTTIQMAQKFKIDDYGIDVLSTVHGRLERGSVFVGLEHNATSEQFISSLQAAVRKAYS